MRLVSWGRGATCALAIVIAMPIAFAGGQRSVASCTSFDQNDKDEDKVELSIKNTCSMPVDCTIKWRVVCAPEAKTRKTLHASSAALTVSTGSTQAAEASAAVCGDDSWTIDNIHWSCEPNKD